jgi:hypothetical protein
MKRLASFAAVASALTVAGPAIAGPFVTLPREDGTSKVGIDVGLIAFDDSESIEGTAIRLDPYAEYVVTDGLSAFANVPLASIEAFGVRESALGNVNVGGALRRELSPELALIGSVALALPTASADAVLDGRSFLGTLVRETDFALIAPDNVVLRPHATGQLRRDKLLAQVGGGLDIGLSTGDGRKLDPLVRLSAAAAYDLGKVSLGGELVAMVTTRSEEATFGERSIGTLALSARGTFGNLAPFGALVLPLDEEIRGGVNAMLSVGLEYRLSPDAPAH